MPRRRFLSAADLAPELDCTVEEVLEAVREGRLLILTPPREVVARIPPRGERGGGYTLSGALVWAQAGLDQWLTAYLDEHDPVDDPVRAHAHGRPLLHQGVRLYVRPDAMARALARRFTPSPRPDRIRDALESAGAVRGRVLGLDPDTDAGRLLWWRVPSFILDRIHKEDA